MTFAMAFQTTLTAERVDQHARDGYGPTTAALELQTRGARRALTTMRIGVGQGISVLLEAA